MMADLDNLISGSLEKIQTTPSTPAFVKHTKVVDWSYSTPNPSPGLWIDRQYPGSLEFYDHA